jgi:hypothetical protein
VAAQNSRQLGRVGGILSLLSIAVIGRLSRRRRKSNQSPVRNIGDGRQAVVPDAALPTALEGVVPATIQDHDLQVAVRFGHGVQDLVDVQALPFDLELFAQPGADRHQKILAVQLHAVSRVVEQRQASFRQVAPKVDQCILHLLQIQVFLFRDLEFQILERPLDGIGVIPRIVECRRPGVPGVPNHQCHSIGRIARAVRAQCEIENGPSQPDPGPTHHPHLLPPNFVM